MYSLRQHDFWIEKRAFQRQELLKCMVCKVVLAGISEDDIKAGVLHRKLRAIRKAVQSQAFL